MRHRAFVVSAMFLLSTLISRADVISGTVSGTLYNPSFLPLYDGLGIFGPRNADLTGASFVATYSYNTADFVPVTLPGPPATAPVCMGCTSYNASNLSADDQITITLNGVPVNFTSTYSAFLDFSPAAASKDGHGSFDYRINSPRGRGEGQGPAILFGFATTGDAVFGQASMQAPTSPYYESLLSIDVSSEETFAFTPTSTAVTPEPSSFVLAGTGLVSAFCFLRRVGRGKRS